VNKDTRADTWARRIGTTERAPVSPADDTCTVSGHGPLGCGGEPARRRAEGAGPLGTGRHASEAVRAIASTPWIHVDLVKSPLSPSNPPRRDHPRTLLLSHTTTNLLPLISSFLAFPISSHCDFPHLSSATRLRISFDSRTPGSFPW
jgi:hypothetical protein